MLHFGWLQFPTKSYLNWLGGSVLAAAAVSSETGDMTCRAAAAQSPNGD